MRLNYESNLEHQSAAVDAVCDIFEGAATTQRENTFWDDGVSGNFLDIPMNKVQQNVKKLTEGIKDHAPTDDLDFSVEMETGTGKTYVYIKTIFQLHQQYGLHKFVILVPSVAIREGVLATFRDTRQHFSQRFNIEPTVIEYSSKKLHDIRSFCATSHLSIIVMNKQAIDSDTNVINAEDRDDGNLLERLQAVRSVVIMDEPQEGMDTPNMIRRLTAFNPLFKLRYSATHRHPKNVIYRLPPHEAYNRGLVKKIAVLSIHETNTQSNVAIRFKRLNLSRRSPTATLILNRRMKGGQIAEREITVKRLDGLEIKSQNPVYNGWYVEDIGTTDLYGGKGYVKFTNGEQINEGEKIGSDRDQIFREQIRHTISKHFSRKEQLKSRGIKPLALFFIDRVANYIDDGGLIRKLFVEEYTAKHLEVFGKVATDVDNVHGGYFAQTSKGEFTDNKRSMEASQDIYDRILRDKTRLLSFDDPLEFIFSHSALGVGWDNPNVFTICTLNQSISQIKKRQEIGRGLRICVGQDGNRCFDAPETPEGQEINLLTIVPNESYHAFVTTYQMELHEELGKHIEVPKIRNAKRPTTKIKRCEKRFNSDDFLHLWQQITKETRCRVYFDEGRLISKGISILSEIVVTENELEISLHQWNEIGERKIKDFHVGEIRDRARGRQTSVNVIGELSRNTALSPSTIVKILSGLPIRQREMLSLNPMGFIAEAVTKLRRLAQTEMVRLVKYEKSGQTLSMEELFAPEVEKNRDLTPTPERGLYDYIIHDSTVEEHMAYKINRDRKVRLFLKLPNTYKIPTPIGNYTPDFALVMEKHDFANPNEETLFYFVIETKGTREFDALKPDEQMKIECAVKHFEALGMRGYLAPIDRMETFKKKAREATGF